VTVRLFLTCLADGFWGEVGVAAVRVLEHAGCTVEFEERQTCCGQPAFNTGDWPSARRMLERAIGLHPGDRPIVVPSASCAAMFNEGAHLLGCADAPVRELSTYLWHDLGVRAWPALQRPVRVAFHRSCHGRMLRSCQR
jgi:L-lactate dehydrogenase complex protein LldE